LTSETHKTKVVIVDDESDMQIFISTLLKENGFDPIVAANETEGLEISRKSNPACIILNAMISADGGIAMYEDLKGDKNLKKIPVILISPIARNIFSQYHKMQRTSKRLDLPDPEAFLENPPDADELLKQVNRLAGTTG
jgi:CheY-like chemotaxis protein